MNLSYMNNVVVAINKDRTRNYQHHYNVAGQMTIEQLRNKLLTKNMKCYSSGLYHFNQLPTCGCEYKINVNGCIAGCSMCNLHDDYESYAYMRVLREQDQVAYSELIKEIYINTRGLINDRSLHEFIFAHNFLNDLEVPEYLLKEILVKDTIYKRKPLAYEFETRADTITYNKLRLLKDMIGHGNVWIRIGVESCYEMIRNSWLNKQETNKQIEKVIELCHSFGFKISCNILIGLPGTTEELSLEHLCDTVLWLDRINADIIICSALSRKKMTLQDYIYQIRSHSLFQDSGLNCEEHTNVPWLFTVLRFLKWVNDRSWIRSKIRFGQFEPEYIDGEITIPYNEEKDCRCNKLILDTVRSISIENSWESFQAIYKSCLLDSCYYKYESVLEKQSGIKSLRQNILLVEEAISQSLFKSKWKDYHETFENELKVYN